MNQDLEQFPYFTGKMLKAFLQKKFPSVTISRWKKNIITIEKGKYTVHENPLVYATVIVTPSYISFRSALHYYQLTNQIPINTQVITKQYKQNTQNIVFYTSKYVWGYEKQKVDTFDLFVAKKEKLLIDCLLYPKAGVMISELHALLKEPLDINSIIKYLQEINNISLIKRCGYLLEVYSLNIYEQFEDKIKQDKNYIALNPYIKKGDVLNHKWRMYINESLP